jgi:hypothetical protein
MGGFQGVNDDWKRYERTAASILNEVAAHLGLDRVEGKQSIRGLRSGTEWEMDAKGCSQGTEAFIIVECRRYTTSKQTQERLGGLAYRIIDSGAEGGIIVTPLGLQKGAEKIAKAEKITSVKLRVDATPEQFAVEFLGNVIVRPRGAQMRAELGKVTVVVSESSEIE